MRATSRASSRNIDSASTSEARSVSITLTATIFSSREPVVRAAHTWAVAPSASGTRSS